MSKEFEKVQSILNNVKTIYIDCKDKSAGTERLQPNLLKRTYHVTPSNLKIKQEIQIFKPIKLDGDGQITKTETDFMTYRTNYMLKFSKNLENFNKIFKYFEYCTISSKNHLIELFNKVKETNDMRDKIIFQEANAVYSNIEFYKKILSLQYDQETAWIRLLESSLREIKRYKEENNSNNRRESEALISKEECMKELMKYRKLVEENNLTYKDKVRNKKLIDSNKIREEYIKREKANLIYNFRLEEE